MRSFSKAWLMAGGLALAVPGFAAESITAADDTWLTLSGTVKSVSAEGFVLDHDGKKVTVEMDDFDPNAEGYRLRKGDKVSVSGVVDDDLFETASLEASSVYVKSLNTYFFASPADEEDAASVVVLTAKPVTLVQGKVTGINGREFTIDSGSRKVTVDTARLGYNPLDKSGQQKIKKGDKVSVVGQVDRDLFESRELMASSVVTLSKADQKATGGSGNE